MRKISRRYEVDESTLIFKEIINIKDNEAISTLYDGPIRDRTPALFTQEEVDFFEFVNQLLIAQGSNTLTEEECKHFLDPLGGRWTKTTTNDEDPTELQRLAGFTVEKTVKYFNDSPTE